VGYTCRVQLKQNRYKRNGEWMKEKWIEISVRVPVELAAVVEKQLTELGSTGIVEDTLGEKGDPVPAEPLVNINLLSPIGFTCHG